MHYNDVGLTDGILYNPVGVGAIDLLHKKDYRAPTFRTSQPHAVLLPGFIISTETFMAGKNKRGHPKTRWADSIKHDLHSAILITTNAAQSIIK